MYVTLGFYCAGSFAHDGYSWWQNTPLAMSAERRIVRQASPVRDASRGQESLVTEQLLALIDVGFADERFEPVLLPQRKSRRNAVILRQPWRRALCSVRHATFPRGSASDPPNALPCELLICADLGVFWPSLNERDAMRQLVLTAEVRYGYIYVGSDINRAHGEHLLVVMHDAGKEQPAWSSEINHLAASRHLFGTRVRGAYWGNFLPTHIVDAIGGHEALVATGASIVERLSPDVTYVQLTSTVGESLGDTGTEHMEKLRALLAPVTV